MVIMVVVATTTEVIMVLRIMVLRILRVIMVLVIMVILRVIMVIIMVLLTITITITINTQIWPQRIIILCATTTIFLEAGFLEAAQPPTPLLLAKSTPRLRLAAKLRCYAAPVPSKATMTPEIYTRTKSTNAAITKRGTYNGV